jgi:hypothetical protein
MAGNVSYFLKFNKEEIFKNLLHAEGHLRNAEPGARPEELQCLIKHLADAEGHADEAISHAAALGDDEASLKFRRLRDMLRDLRREFQAGLRRVEDGIRRVREARGFFESFNPEFDVSRCTACGESLRKALEALGAPKASLRALEEELAERVVEEAAKRHGVPRPRLVILDACPSQEPSLYAAFKVLDGQPTIEACRGAVDRHKVLHEFGHYLQYLRGQPLDEEEAERFALEALAPHEKALNEGAAAHPSGGSMPTWREVGLIYGGSHIAKGLERAFVEVDKYVGKAASPVQERPSTWLNVVLGVALPVVSAALKVKKEPLGTLLALVGAHMSTKVWDYVEEYMAAAGGGGAAAYRAYVPATPAAPASAPAAEIY